VTKAVYIDVVTSFTKAAIVAALGVSYHVEETQVPIVQTMLPTFKALPMKFKRCFKLHHRWQRNMNSCPLKDAFENSCNHMDLTSQDYGKQL